MTALRLKRQSESGPGAADVGDTSPILRAAQSGSRESGHELWGGWGLSIGFALFAGLIFWVVLAPSAGRGFSPSDLLVSWPSWLIVLGCAVALAVLLGNPGDGRALALGFAYAGGVSALFGLVRALHGFAEISIPLVSAGSSWMISSCFVALVGMLTVAASMQDRVRRCEGGLSRLAWYGLPSVSLIILALVVLMVMTPITMK